VAANTIGDALLTASCGDFSRVWTLKLNTPSGIDGIDTDKAIVSETYYTVGGIRVDKPSNRDGQAYIVVRTYGNGSVKAQKMIDK